ncbi:MAG: hypothetical protein ACK5VB_04585 [Bacteroidota bacterium]
MTTVSESIFSFSTFCDGDKKVFTFCFAYIKEVRAALASAYFFGKYTFFSIAPFAVAIETAIISVAKVVTAVAEATATAAALKTAAAATLATAAIVTAVTEAAPVAIAATTI